MATRPSQAKLLSRTRVRIWPPHQTLVLKLRQKGLIISTGKQAVTNCPMSTPKPKHRRFIICSGNQVIVKYLIGTRKLRQKSLTTSIPKRSRYQALDRGFFKSDERVQFYTGLPSYEILMALFKQAAPHVNRRTQ